VNLAGCAWWWITEHATVLATVISALAAAVVAFFTYTLKQSTKELATNADRQARLTRDSVDLARQEFLATHRPQIIIRTVSFKWDAPADTHADDFRIGAFVDYTNIGVSRANVIEVVAQITHRPHPLEPGIQIVVEQQSLPGDLPSGIGGYFHLKSEQSLYAHRHIQETEGEARRGRIICMGKIVYLDDMGARRVTGFCRELDAVRERWMPIDNPEYEYAY
jgi:hypothetical protein